MSKPWVSWYSPAMGAQEQLWCASRIDDVEHVRRCLAMGASASLPGPAGNAMSLAWEHQSYCVCAAMGWVQETQSSEEMSLDQLDQAIAQIDSVKSGLGIQQQGDDFLDILPYLGNATLVPEDPLGWASPAGIPQTERMALFRMAHQHEAVLVMLSHSSAPALLLSESGARKWAPRLLESAAVSSESIAGTTLN